MSTRRQEKVARVVREAVSDAIANHLSDPRIEAFVSVTRVEVSADMRIANVYLSMFGGTEVVQKDTFNAIMHAKKRIQVILAERIKSKFCPTLNIHRDEQFKKALETMLLIDKLAEESKNKDSVDQEND
jgi:ribosome-binding factor A